MGRFVHEAIAIDRETGIVYETEDRMTAGFYRFVPKQKGKLAASPPDRGSCGQPDLRGRVSKDSVFDVKWHTIQNQRVPTRLVLEEPDELGVFKQGKRLGGTTFSRLEGCVRRGNGSIYFECDQWWRCRKQGQIWEYDPASQKLRLLFESPGKEVLNMPDNLCVNPHGGLAICEDGDYGDNEFPQRIHILSQDGILSPLALNDVVLQGEKRVRSNYSGWQGMGRSDV